jgi:hypothetical protein
MRKMEEGFTRRIWMTVVVDVKESSSGLTHHQFVLPRRGDFVGGPPRGVAIVAVVMGVLG